MKKILLIILIFLNVINVFAQRDTTVIIVDKNADYVFHEENLVTTDKYYDYTKEYTGQDYFSMYIKCHYYDGKSYDWLARVVISQIKKGYRKWKIDDYEIIIKKSDISKYKTISADLINQAKTEMEVDHLVGLYASEDKVLYVVFKRDLQKDSITLYRVIAAAWGVSH